MKLYIDISKAPDSMLDDLTFLREMPDYIPVKKGSHQRDLDIIEDELDPEVVKRARDHLMKTFPSSRRRQAELYPMGADWPLPEGCRLIQVLEDDEIEVRTLKNL